MSHPVTTVAGQELSFVADQNLMACCFDMQPNMLFKRTHGNMAPLVTAYQQIGTLFTDLHFPHRPLWTQHLVQNIVVHLGGNPGVSCTGMKCWGFTIVMLICPLTFRLKQKDLHKLRLLKFDVVLLLSGCLALIESTGCFYIHGSEEQTSGSYVDRRPRTLVQRTKPVAYHIPRKKWKQRM
jgi:hypothetical protein